MYFTKEVAPLASFSFIVTAKKFDQLSLLINKNNYSIGISNQGIVGVHILISWLIDTGVFVIQFDLLLLATFTYESQDLRSKEIHF